MPAGAGAASTAGSSVQARLIGSCAYATVQFSSNTSTSSLQRLQNISCIHCQYDIAAGCDASRCNMSQDAVACAKWAARVRCHHQIACAWLQCSAFAMWLHLAWRAANTTLAGKHVMTS
jgi:hypothetical protein